MTNDMTSETNKQASWREATTDEIAAALRVGMRRRGHSTVANGDVIWYEGVAESQGVIMEGYGPSGTEYWARNGGVSALAVDPDRIDGVREILRAVSAQPQEVARLCAHYAVRFAQGTMEREDALERIEDMRERHFARLAHIEALEAQQPEAQAPESDEERQARWARERADMDLYRRARDYAHEHGCSMWSAYAVLDPHPSPLVAAVCVALGSR